MAKSGVGEVVNALLYMKQTGCPWRYLPHDLPPWAAVHQQVTPASARERAQVGDLADAVQAATGSTVELAYVDQGYTGEDPAEAAAERGIELAVVRLPEATKGFVLVPRRWVVERSFAWATRFRRLAKDYERLPATVAGLHFVAFACLMLHKLMLLPIASP